MAKCVVLKKLSKAPRRGDPVATKRGAAKKQKIKLERAHGSRDCPVLSRAGVVAVAERVARSGGCARTFSLRKARAMKVAGGVTFPKASFEARSCYWVLPPAEWLVVCVCVVEAIAERAVEEAPECMRRHLGYPLRQGNLLGKLSCRVKAFEKDLDGIRVASVVVFGWRFSHKNGDV